MPIARGGMGYLADERLPTLVPHVGVSRYGEALIVNY